MRAKLVSEALRQIIPLRQAVYLWGEPGIGKSALVKSAASSLGLPMIDVRAVLLDPVDLRGLPHVNGDGRAHWCPPAFLPDAGEGILFLDELAQAAPLVQSACLQLVLDRRIGEYELPAGWSIVAASNRQQDRAGAHRLITPLLNRFVHLDLEVSNDDWQDWALEAGINPTVRAFLRFKTGCLHQFDAASGDRAFATPRAWEFVSNLLPVASEETRYSLVGGAVGAGAAAEFEAFWRTWHELPDVDELLADPERGKVPSKPDVLYALCGAMADRAKGMPAGDKRLAALVRYGSRLPREFGMLLLRDALALNNQAKAAGAGKPPLMEVAEMQQWLRDNQDLLLEDKAK